MSELLFRFRDETGDRVEWCSTDPGTLQLHAGSLEELAGAASGQRLVLVADGARLTVVSANVPSRQRATILKALPYALEEQFADDVESLHFAIGERLPSGELGVVTCRHSELQGWMQRCSEAGISPVAVVPESLLIPWQEGEWTLIGDQARTLVRFGLWHAFVVDSGALSVLLAQVDAGRSETLSTVRLFGGLSASDVPEAIRPLVHESEDGLPTLALLATQYRPGHTLNLLQGAYSPRAKVGRYVRPWRMAAALLLGLLVVQAGSMLTKRSRLQAESRQLADESEQIYRATFPEARNVVDARLQMERQLQALRREAGSDGSGLLDLIERSGPVLLGEKGLRVNGLNYRNGELNLSITATSLATVDVVRQKLNEESGLQVEIQSASSRDGRVEGRLLIRSST
jgi:general secretion pathway protein L